VDIPVKRLMSVVSMLGRNRAAYNIIAAHCVYLHLEVIEHREVPLRVIETLIQCRI
jgi:hypothetical protein